MFLYSTSLAETTVYKLLLNPTVFVINNVIPHNMHTYIL